MIWSDSGLNFFFLLSCFCNLPVCQCGDQPLPSSTLAKCIESCYGCLEVSHRGWDGCGSQSWRGSVEAFIWVCCLTRRRSKGKDYITTIGQTVSQADFSGWESYNAQQLHWVHSVLTFPRLCLLETLRTSLKCKQDSKATYSSA